VKQGTSPGPQPSEELLAAIFHQTMTGIVYADLEGRFILANQRYCELVGRPLEELV
jgi:PAS domain S-box-containing protein